MASKYTSEYRNQLFADVLSGKVPDRVPEKVGISGTAVLEWAGYDLRTAQYGYSKNIDAMKKFNAEFDTDNVCGGFGGAAPFYTKVIGSRTNVMGSDGFMQHPDVAGMEVDEYDDFIADPVKFIWDTVIPRVFTEFAQPWPHNAFALLKMIKTQDEVMGHLGRASAECARENNKVTRAGGGGISRAPFDYFADYLRSFTGAMIDMKRMPDKVLEAVDAITPLMIKCANDRVRPTDRTSQRVFFALHMPTYMTVKDFEKFWWPSFKETVWGVYDKGFGIQIFCEENWMRMLDYLDELPDMCELQFEYGDPKTVKEKVGKKHVISAMYPLTYLANGTLEEACDKVKEYLDILAPGGKYIFNMDKSVLRGRQIDWNKLNPWLDCIHTYGKY
ncbi:MAG: uroporphyrinogen decarboxylase [Eubacteriaceae bacterium]|nr:uroporphyrinogen decarboxylase [Eubacteriaceae bacterium]